MESNEIGEFEHVFETALSNQIRKSTCNTCQCLTYISWRREQKQFKTLGSVCMISEILGDVSVNY